MERKEIYTCYSPSADITFIMEDVFRDNEYISTEVKGFYYGEPDEEATEYFYGDLKSSISD